MGFRVFLAQPVDGIEREEIAAAVRKVEALLEGTALELVVPYLTDDWDPGVDHAREVASSIVERDYGCVRSCNVFVADLSNEGRLALGMIFEMACAVQHGLKVVVYAGKSSIGERVWIRALAEEVCQTWQDVRTGSIPCSFLKARVFWVL